MLLKLLLDQLAIVEIRDHRCRGFWISTYTGEIAEIDTVIEGLHGAYFVEQVLALVFGEVGLHGLDDCIKR